MPNKRTYYIDVDLTLIDMDDHLLPGVVEGLQFLRRKGFKLICWSMGGEDYAKSVCERYGIDKYFDLFLDKPHGIIDDDPELLLDPRCVRIFRVTGRKWWEGIINQVFTHVWEEDEPPKDGGGGQSS